MTQEDKELLLKDLSARLPYGVKVFIKDTTGKYLAITERIFDTYVIQFFKNNNILIKPYLRPLSSMTEEERKEYKHFIAFSGSPERAANLIDWLNKKMFAYRTKNGKNMFELGLALQALDGMYKID